MHRRQELVAVAEVVLADLARGVARGFQQLCQRRVALLNAARPAVQLGWP
jgi:hypothetical protein